MVLHNQGYSINFLASSSSYSICEKALHGIYPTSHMGMPMMCNNLSKANLTNEGQ
jgi:hypothetical protein